MTKPILLVDAKKYYKELPHQKDAVDYLGNLLLKTPAKKRLGLEKVCDWIHLPDSALIWLQRQISAKTLTKFALIYRGDVVSTYKEQIEKYSQLDNSIKPYTSCNSSAHAMYTNSILVLSGKKGLGGDDGYVRKVYSGKYGTYKHNNSMSWDVQQNVVRSYGINSKYISGDLKGLIAQVKRGILTPTNFRHKGSSSKSYGGHVVCIADYNPKKGYLLYDPFGSRMPSYTNQTKDSGIYWITAKEFHARWQGIWSKFLGFKK